MVLAQGETGTLAPGGRRGGADDVREQDRRQPPRARVSRHRAPPVFRGPSRAYTRRAAPERRSRRIGQIHEHDVGVLAPTIEYDRLAVGRDVEALDQTGIGEVGQRAALPGREVDLDKVPTPDAVQVNQGLSATREAIRAPRDVVQPDLRNRHDRSVRRDGPDDERAAPQRLGIEDVAAVWGP